MRKTMATLVTCVLLAVFCMAQPVFADDYPTRPIKMLTMVGPGAQIDLLTRRLADELSKELGQPVLVTNMPGGSHGSVMATELASADPDGYTLGTSATAAFTYSPHHVKTKYGIDDFDFLSMLGLNQSGIVCNKKRPWKTLQDAFDWAKKEDTGLAYMFQGSDDRDVMQRIAKKEGVKLSLMPSQGGPSVIQAVMGGHADLGHLGAILFGYVPNELNLLAATTPERLTKLPDYPTLKEQGWDESVEMFVVLAAPDGLPQNVADSLEEAIQNLAKNEDFRTFITDKLRNGPVKFGRDEAEQYMHKTYERFGKQKEADG